MTRPVYKNEKIYFFIFWLLYTYLSIYFLRERCTYADNSYYLFNIIQNKTLNLEHYRYAGFFSQWLVVIAVNLKLPYQLILCCFTICPVVYHFCLFLLVYFISNKKLYIYMYLTILVGAVYYCYYFTSDEMSQNMPVLMVLAAVIKSDKITLKLKYLLLLLCQLILLFTHPLIIAVAGLLIFVLFVIERNAVSGFVLLGIIAMLLIKFMLLSTERDHSLMGEISYKAITLRNIHASNFAVFFRTEIIERHLLLVVLWGILFFSGRASAKSKGLIVISIVGLYLLIMLFLLQNVNKVYIDRYLYLLLVYAFAAILIVSSFEIPKAGINTLMVLIISFSFYKLFTQDYLQNRIQLLDKMLRNKEIKQIYLYHEMPEYIQQMSWSVPYETLLASTLHHNTKTVLIKEPFYKIDHLLSDSSLFLGAEWAFEEKTKLDTNYFNLPKDIYHYK